MTDTVPQRIVRRVIAEKRAGAPDGMIARHAITEALHAITGHDGPATDCTPCHEAMNRAVDDVRTPRPLDLTGCCIVVPDPPNLPSYQWGESVTWSRGRILVPLNLDDVTFADLELDENSAGILAAMLTDAAAGSSGILGV